MTRLTSIDIHGFKSFAEPTHIAFSPTLNAVLAPSGCGKTALLDAIRWVSADDSAEQTSDTVIFHGTKTRAALDTAEVTVTFSDNTGEETNITRTARKNGDGTVSDDFSVNGKNANIGEVRNLLKEKSFCLIDDCNKKADFGKKTADKARQYIIVTENKSIATQAETLVGIAMEEAEVSKSIFNNQMTESLL